MTILSKRYYRSAKVLFDQIVIAIGNPDLKSKWSGPSSQGLYQLTLKIGHTFTESPHFPDEIHQAMTTRLHTLLDHLHYDKRLVAASTACIDRGEGEIIVDIPAEIFETLHERIRTLRDLTIKHAEAAPKRPVHR